MKESDQQKKEDTANPGRSKIRIELFTNLQEKRIKNKEKKSKKKKKEPGKKRNGKQRGS